MNLESIAGHIVANHYSSARGFGKPLLPVDDVIRIVSAYLHYRNVRKVVEEIGFYDDTITKYLHMMGFGDLRKGRKFKQKGARKNYQ
ncbi:MAG: hypothetical protein AABX28_02710 [Nanoarchaeota archaeon]